jgi:hypothetical protein
MREIHKFSIGILLFLGVTVYASLDRAEAQFPDRYHRPLETARFEIDIDSIVLIPSSNGTITYKAKWDNGTVEIKQVQCFTWRARTLAFYSPNPDVRLFGDIETWSEAYGWIFTPDEWSSIPRQATPANASAIFLCRRFNL